MVAIFEFNPSATAFVMRGAKKFITPVRWSLIIAATRFMGSRREWVAQKYHRLQ
jgi:hypothetical protein